MRLTTAQVHALINGITPFVHGANIELRLYGDRIHDHMKGGDIDLLILAEQAGVADNLLELKYVLLSSMKKFIGDQKINLRIEAREDVHQDSLLKTLISHSILLHRW